MRVLVLCWEYPPVIAGGLARHVEGLSRALSAEGVEVHVLTRGQAHGEDSGTSRRGVRVHRLALPEPPARIEPFIDWVAVMNERLAAAGAALAEDWGFDLVHSHDWLVADAARALVRAADTPWLVTVHATEHG